MYFVLFKTSSFFEIAWGHCVKNLKVDPNNMQNDNCEEEYKLRSRLENTNEGRGRPRVEIAQSQLEAYTMHEAFVGMMLHVCYKFQAEHCADEDTNWA
jgi:hypothetical protein